MSRRGLRAFLCVCLVAALSGRASAHDPFEVTADGVVGVRALVLVVTMTRDSAARLVAPPVELSRLEQVAATLFEVSSAGATLELKAREVRFMPEKEVEFRLTYAAPQPGQLRFVANHLRTLPHGYATALTLRGEAPGPGLGQKFLHADDVSFELALIAPQSAAPAAREPWTRTSRRWLVLGVEHVLTGYDHLLFLAGLLLACRGAKALLALVTSFTVAHSASLVLSTLLHVSAPPRLVEPLIAASLVFLGVENFLARGEPRRRYLLAFGFGLVHGLGFATALSGVARGEPVVLSLFSFNLGVELAQVLVAGLALPLLALLRKRSFGAQSLRYVSLAIALVGTYWTIERVASGV